MATYYVDTASAGGDGTTQELSGANAAFATIAAVNATSFSAGDSILFKRGCTWREGLTLNQSGTVGNTITYGAYGTGAAPRILGSELLTTWEEDTGHWKATLTGTVRQCFFLETGGSVSWGAIKANKASCVAEYDWYSDGSFVWVYAATDPTTRYSGVEATVRNNGILENASLSYLVVDGLEVAYCSQFGIKFANTTGSHLTVSNCTVHHIGQKEDASGMADCIIVQGSDHIVEDCTVHNAGIHGIYVLSDGAGKNTDRCIVRRNVVYDNCHTGIDIMCTNGTNDGTVVERNKIYTTSAFADMAAGAHLIQLQGHQTAVVYVDNCAVRYNLLYNLVNGGIVMAKYTRGALIYNNTIYGRNPDYAARVDGIMGDPLTGSSGNIVKNNLVMDCIGGACFYLAHVSSIVSAADNNLWYQSAGGAAIYTQMVGVSSYHFDDQAAYQAATAYDDNGLWEDPLFVNAAGLNFHRQDNSPCVNAGVDVGLTTDYDGITISGNPDIGAFESSGAIPDQIGLFMGEWM